MAQRLRSTRPSGPRRRGWTSILRSGGGSGGPDHRGQRRDVVWPRAATAADDLRPRRYPLAPVGCKALQLVRPTLRRTVRIRPQSGHRTPHEASAGRPIRAGARNTSGECQPAARPRLPPRTLRSSLGTASCPAQKRGVSPAAPAGLPWHTTRLRPRTRRSLRGIEVVVDTSGEKEVECRRTRTTVVEQLARGYVHAAAEQLRAHPPVHQQHVSCRETVNQSSGRHPRPPHRHRQTRPAAACTRSRRRRAP